MHLKMKTIVEKDQNQIHYFGIKSKVMNKNQKYCQQLVLLKVSSIYSFLTILSTFRILSSIKFKIIPSISMKNSSLVVGNKNMEYYIDLMLKNKALTWYLWIKMIWFLLKLKTPQMDGLEPLFCWWEILQTKCSRTTNILMEY